MNKVLIVDDHEDIRRMIALTLADDFQIFEASNARHAEEIIRREVPDVVVLDVMMPGGMDGFELCGLIKRDDQLKHIWVILVTARAQESDLAQGNQAGADSYYVKPFSPLALIKEIEAHVGQRGGD